jgi:hypothetical protein
MATVYGIAYTLATGGDEGIQPTVQKIALPLRAVAVA